MVKVEQIAQWFTLRAAEDVNKGGEYLTQLKLQKLMYYAQGFYYAFNDKKLFNDKIIHMPYGPAVESMLSKLRGHGSDQIKSLNISVGDLPHDVITILSLVYDKLGQYSAYKLVELTHNEWPWQNTDQGKEIKANVIGEYFKRHYIK